MAEVRRRSTAKDTVDVASMVGEWAQLDKNIKTMSGRRDAVKKRLSAVVEERGLEDDKGHILLELDEPVDGIVGLQRQRRVSQTLDESRAGEIISEHGLEETCYKTIRVIDEDAVMAAFYDDKLAEADIDAMFPKRVSYAFLPMKATA